LAQQISKAAIVRAKPDSFPKLDLVFNWLEHFVERSEALLWKSKRLIFGLGFALFLIYELAHFGKFLVARWSR
jgi:hypothetical protein